MNCRSPVIRPSVRRYCSACRTEPPPEPRLVLEEPIGPVRCMLEGRERRSAAARALRSRNCRAKPDRRLTTRRSRPRSHLAPADIGFDRYRPARWSAGNRLHLCAGLGPRRHGAARPDPPSSMPRSARRHGGGVSSIAASRAEPGHDFHARMFAPGMRPYRGSGDRLGCGRIRRHVGASRGPVRRRARHRDRAGLRDGAAEPDRSYAHAARRQACVGGRSAATP